MDAEVKMHGAHPAVAQPFFSDVHSPDKHEATKTYRCAWRVRLPDPQLVCRRYRLSFFFSRLFSKLRETL